MGNILFSIFTLPLFPDCPNGFVWINNRCFKLTDQSLPHFHFQQCADSDSHIFTPLSEKDALVAQELLDIYGATEAFVGNFSNLLKFDWKRKISLYFFFSGVQSTYNSDKWFSLQGKDVSEFDRWDDSVTEDDRLFGSFAYMTAGSDKWKVQPVRGPYKSSICEFSKY